MRGILKTQRRRRQPADSNSSSGIVQFNEDNLAQNEAEKPANRMVIDEPKTPFHYPNSDEGSDGIDEMRFDASDDGNTGGSVDSSSAPRVVIINDDCAVASDITEAAISRRYNEWETSESDDTERKFSDRRHSEKFKQQRKEHYNEFQAVRRLREIKPNFEEDEDEDDAQQPLDDDLMS